MALRMRILVLVLGLLATLVPAVAQAQGDAVTGPVIQDGVSQPAHSYADATRERVFVISDFDSDADGETDVIAMDIIRPASSGPDFQVPVIMDASPYYSTVGRGNESELKRDVDGDGILESFPLFYDNYFVPRGYAVIQLDMVGTNNSTGCPVTGGTPDNLSAVVAIDWLNGRRSGYDAAGNAVVADWHNGRTGMIGKSYDGTLANAAAATGVEGLATIVPISAISNWYFYTRMNGIVTRSGSYPSSLSNTVTDADRRAYCAPTRDAMASTDGDETGDYTPFWVERDYLPHTGNVRASVFVIHGLQDDNVRTNHFSEWWYELGRLGVPRKLWLGMEGHVDPFDFRRAEWVDTLHRWFDYWLWQIDNGIMDEPQVDIEVTPDVFETYESWPVPGTEVVDMWLRPGTLAVTNGTLSATPGTDGAAAFFLDSSTQQEATMTALPELFTPNRLVFLSEPLAAPLRLSGTPYVRLRASSDKADTNLGAMIVDFGSGTHLARTGEGVTTSTTESCYGESTAEDDGCYREVTKVTQTATEWRVNKGILDAVNRDSLATATNLEPGRMYDFTFDLLPNDYTFPAGHRIGVVIVGSYPGFSSQADTNGAMITVDLNNSRVSLPLAPGAATTALELVPSGIPAGPPPVDSVVPVGPSESEIEVPGL